MTTTTPQKPVKLSLAHQAENILFCLALCIVYPQAAFWTMCLCLRSYSKWHKKHPGQTFKPMMPKVIDCWCIGKRPAIGSVGVVLKAYNIRYFTVGYEWSVQQNYIGMHVRVIVNPSLFDKADSVLYHAANGLWIIESPQGALRHVQFQQHKFAGTNKRIPATKRTAPAAPKQARLGRTAL